MQSVVKNCKIVDILDVVDMLDIVGLEEGIMEEKEYLDTTEAAAFLGVSRPTLFRFIKSYSIQTYTLVGKTNYFKRVDLQRVKDLRNQFKPKNSPQLAAAA